MNFLMNPLTSSQEILLLLKIIFAFFLGAIIGWEREMAGKEAGIRTFGCIAMGSAAFSIFSTLLNFADPSRIAAQIVLGIGFLGSGLFMRNEKVPSGLTTAASLWVAAAVGMGVGFAYYILATGLALITVASLHLPSAKIWTKLSTKNKQRLGNKKS